MIRKIIKIDEKKCNGCGACAIACHEGAIEMIDGKAKLTRENYCDGLGDCLAACPTNAISFEEREAPAYDEVAVLASKQNKELKNLGRDEVAINDDGFLFISDVSEVFDGTLYITNFRIVLLAPKYGFDLHISKININFASKY